MALDLSKKLCALAKAMKANFTLYDKPISYEEVFSETGLLPAIAKRADQLCSLCLGYGIGVVFQEVDKSLVGIKVQFDDITPNILRFLCICDVLSELMRNSAYSDKTPLDELLYD